VIYLLSLAFSAGILVGVSRSVNGRLSLSSSPLTASWWNHVVGCGFLSVWIVAMGGWPAGWPDVPPLSWLGGTLGVVFVAGGSYLIPRIGAVATALLIISGQMISGVILDLATGLSAAALPRTAGVALILAGMYLAHTARPESEPAAD
jgi:transporter family-2 protein